MPSRHWLYFGGFVLSGIFLAGAVLMGVLDALSVLTGQVATREEFILLTMLGEAAEWVVVAIVFGLFGIVFLGAAIISVLRNASIPRSDRLVSLVERLEREYPPLKELDVSQKVEPTTEDRQQQLKDRYVTGDISDEEFEREMEQLIDEDSSTTRGRVENTQSPEREK